MDNFEKLIKSVENVNSPGNSAPGGFFMAKGLIIPYNYDDFRNDIGANESYHCLEGDIRRERKRTQDSEPSYTRIFPADLFCDDNCAGGQLYH